MFNQIYMKLRSEKQFLAVMFMEMFASLTLANKKNFFLGA